MSRKLATQIKDSAIPGKWKRVAEAYAAVANNDGTNIYRSKKNLGKLAGCSPDTIYRQTPDLLACGLLSVAKSHVCKVANCNKGATHFTGTWGHYTTAYNLNIGFLRNAETYLSAKYQEVSAAKRRKVGDAHCGTTLTLKETPAPLTKTDSSALTSGDREQASQSPSLAALATAIPPRPTSSEDRGGTPPAPPVVSGSEANEEDQTENRKPVVDEFWSDGIFEPAGYLLAEIMPKPSAAAIDKGLPLCRRILAHFDDADKYAGVAAGLVLKYNRAHRGQKYATKEDRVMYLRTPEQYLKALESENATLMNDYLTHDFKNCELCGEAGVLDYRAMIRDLEQNEREQKEQRIAEEKRRKEAERLAKLCARCKKYPHGSMSLEQGKDFRNNPIMVRVCDGCYDGAYEFRKRGLDARLNVLDKRPGYAPPKFDTITATPEDAKALASWFAENGKVGDWSTNREERTALGTDAEHLFGVLRYLNKNQEKVTRDQFVALLLECAAERPKPAEQMAYAAGDEL